MLRFLPLPQRFVVLPETIPALAPAFAQEVESIWQAEKSQRGPGLFNGPLFSVDQISEETVFGHFVEYRLFLAQMRRPELFAELRIQPLAVTGLLQNAEGLFFGFRSSSAAQQPDCWELIPAGGIDDSTLTDHGEIKPQEQILAELEEEVGLSRAAVAAPQLVSFCEELSHVFDLVWELNTSLESISVINALEALDQIEHTNIICVRWMDLEAFLADHSQVIAAGNRDLLHHIAPQKNRV
jgi:hypothetical protein